LRECHEGEIDLTITKHPQIDATNEGIGFNFSNPPVAVIAHFPPRVLAGDYESLNIGQFCWARSFEPPQLLFVLSDKPFFRVIRDQRFEDQYSVGQCLTKHLHNLLNGVGDPTH
jgi:hypothetical protein